MSVVINGSAGVTTNSGAVYNGIQAGTAVASTSGTSIDFTSIPSWVKRITVMFNGVSLSGATFIYVQLGDSGGVENTGYLSYAGYSGSTNAAGANSATAGFHFNTNTAANLLYGHMILTNVSGNLWVSSSSSGLNASGVAYCLTGGGNKTLSDVLTQIRITSSNGTDTFDAGSINILYE
jgi:hypothetical protein